MQSLLLLLTTRWYWLALALFGIALESVALYYQYVVGDEPCQLCIHTRIWVAAFTLVGIVMCLAPKKLSISIVAHLLVLVAALGLGERAWNLYQVENGMGGMSCQFYLGFPDWFALDKWFPAVFEVRNLCSYTPELLFGISMAEGLLAVSGGMLVVTGAAVYAVIRQPASTTLRSR